MCSDCAVCACLCVWTSGTIFAYGQTSSGKTFTMMGSEHLPGVIPMAVEDVFQTIKNVRGALCLKTTASAVPFFSSWRVTSLFLQCPKKEFLLRVSYMEIYNETVTDLLVDSWKRKPLEVREAMNVGLGFSLSLIQTRPFNLLIN